MASAGLLVEVAVAVDIGCGCFIRRCRGVRNPCWWEKEVPQLPVSGYLRRRFCWNLGVCGLRAGRIDLSRVVRSPMRVSVA